MSQIDSFKHSIVGYFLGIPVYLPKEDIRSFGDFICSTKQLLLGGGDGEHPAIVIENPLASVARFFEEALPHTDIKKHQREEWKQVYEPYIQDDNSKLLTFIDWTIEDYHCFFERCSSPHSYAINRYKIYENDMSLEDWLILGFGEFIFFSMPQLCDEILSKLDNPYQYFQHMSYNNILLIPPNMPVYANSGNEFFDE